MGAFPLAEQASLRGRLAKTLRYVISQQLIPGKTGGRVAILEVFKNTPRTVHYLDCPGPFGRYPARSREERRLGRNALFRSGYRTADPGGSCGPRSRPKLRDRPSATPEAIEPVKAPRISADSHGQAKEQHRQDQESSKKQDIDPRKSVKIRGFPAFFPFPTESPVAIPSSDTVIEEKTHGI